MRALFWVVVLLFVFYMISHANLAESAFARKKGERYEFQVIDRLLFPVEEEEFVDFLKEYSLKEEAARKLYEEGGTYFRGGLYLCKLTGADKNTYNTVWFIIFTEENLKESEAKKGLVCDYTPEPVAYLLNGELSDPENYNTIAARCELRPKTPLDKDIPKI
jgi:hypothetical protein